MCNGVECKRPIALRQKIREHLISQTCPVVERQARTSRLHIRSRARDKDCIPDIDQTIRGSDLALNGLPPNVHFSDLNAIEGPSGYGNRACNYEPVGACSSQTAQHAPATPPIKYVKLNSHTRATF